MSERITDEFMTDLEAKHGKIENDYRPTCATVNYGNGCPGATDDSTAFWRAAVDCVPAMIAELKERRALDREIARQSDVVREYHRRWTAYPSGATADLLAILSRLVKQEGES